MKFTSFQFDKFNLLNSFFLDFFTDHLKTPILVTEIKSNKKKKVSGLVPLLYMYLINTKFKNFLFQF